MDVLDICQKVLKGEQPSLPTWCEHMQHALPWLNDLADTPQDPEYHAEGNVYIHTEKVLDCIYAQQQPTHHRLALVLAAVLHDIGKVATTKFYDGRWRSPRHAYKGRNYVALRLLSLGLPFELTQKVCGLVGYHHHPRKLLLESSPAGMWQQLLRCADVDMLYFLERADILGRVCSDQNELLEDLELFKLSLPEPIYSQWEIFFNTHCQDLEHAKYCLQTAMYDYERSLIFTPEEALARSYPWLNKRAELMVMCGLSGSGKSSYIAEYFPQHIVISMDDIREDFAGEHNQQRLNGQVWQRAKEELKTALRTGKKIVWDATSLTRDARNKIITLGMDYHARVQIITLCIPENIAQKRNRLRSRSVPALVIAAQLQRFELPELSEAHEVSFIGY